MEPWEIGEAQVQPQERSTQGAGCMVPGFGAACPASPEEGGPTGVHRRRWREPMGSEGPGSQVVAYTSVPALWCVVLPATPKG
jgi:hypothetical protein